MQKHKLLSFVLALLAAIMLWVYAVTVVNPDDQISISGVPVRITGLNGLQMNQLMITGGESQSVDVEIAGRRSDLKELNSDTLKVIADVSKLVGPGTYELSWVLDPPATVATGDIKLVSSSTNKIKIKVSEFKERNDIPVQIEYRGSQAEGYVRDSAITDLQTVSVSGPAEELDKISYARIVMNLADTKTSLDQEMEYEFVGEDGNPLNLSTYVTVHDPVIRVMVPVYCYKQILLELDLVPGDGVGTDDATYKIDPPALGVVGDEEILKELDSTLTIRTIKLADIKDEITFTVTPELPEGVSIRGETTTVEVSVKLEGISERTIYVPTTQILRVNDDSSLKFAMERIPVTVRGKTEVLHRLSADKILITADMKNGFDPAAGTVALEVFFANGVEAGVTGEYSIPVMTATEDSNSNEKTGDR